MDIKNKTHKPKTIQEAIDSLQTFLECDLYTQLKPEMKIKGEDYIRSDVIKNEKEFIEYLRFHFDILEKEIKELSINKMSKKEDSYVRGKKALSRLRGRN